MSDFAGWEFEDQATLDSDYFLALQLQQAELLKERYEAEKLRERHSPLRHQKVSCARFSSGVHAYYTEDDGAYDSGESLSEEEEYQTALTRKQHHVVSKTNGRISAKEQKNTPESAKKRQDPVAQPTYNHLPPELRRLKQEAQPVVQYMQDTFDEKTAATVGKLITQKILQKMSGAVGQGKEATIYYALGGSSTPSKLNEHYAVKVFKTSNMEFNHREIYINGLWQARYQEVRINPRKFIKLWAEKEFRNLKKLSENGLPVPKPILVRNNVVIMSFIGNEGWSFPKLADCVNKLDMEILDNIYWQIVSILKRMYKHARLIHAALSPYNILVRDDNTIVVVDVPQSVDIDHKNSTHFLRRDCNNITNFFRSKGIITLKTRQLYEFVSNKDLDDDGLPSSHYNLDREIEKLKENVTEWPEQTAEERAQEQIWMNIDLPKYLKDILDPIDLPEDGVFHSAIVSLNLVKT